MIGEITLILKRLSFMLSLFFVIHNQVFAVEQKLSHLILDNDLINNRKESSVYTRDYNYNVVNYSDDSTNLLFNKNLFVVGYSKMISDSSILQLEAIYNTHNFIYDKDINIISHRKDMSIRGLYKNENLYFLLETSKDNLQLFFDAKYPIIDQFSLGLALKNMTLFRGDFIIDSEFQLPINFSDNSLSTYVNYTNSNVMLGIGFNIKRLNLEYDKSLIKNNSSYKSIYLKYDINSEYSFSVLGNFSTSNGNFYINGIKESYTINGKFSTKNSEFITINSPLNDFYEIKMGYNSKKISIEGYYNQIKGDSLQGVFIATPVIPEAFFAGNYYKFRNNILDIKNMGISGSYLFEILSQNIKILAGYNNYQWKSELLYKERYYYAYPLPYFSYTDEKDMEIYDFNEKLLFVGSEISFNYKKIMLQFGISQFIPVNNFFKNSSTHDNNNIESDGLRTINLDLFYFFDRE